MSLQQEIAAIAQEFDWDRLTDAYGYCFWVPKQLERLGSENPHERKNARGYLYEMLHHQQTHYRGTGELCVVLIRLSRLPKLPEREKLLSLAAEIMYVDEKTLHRPMLLAFSPSNWSFHWPLAYEDSFAVLLHAKDDLWNMVQQELGYLRYWAARILQFIHSYQARLPVRRSPVQQQTFEEQTLINEVLSGPKFKLNSDDYDGDDDDEAHPSDPDDTSAQKSELSDLIDSIPSFSILSENPNTPTLLSLVGPEFPTRLNELTKRELSEFAQKMQWDHSWQMDEEFVAGLLSQIDSKVKTIDDFPVADNLIGPLSSTRVMQREVAELFFEFAFKPNVQHQQVATQALFDLEWPSRDRIAYLTQILSNGPFPAQSTLLGCIYRGASNMRWIGKPKSADPDNDINVAAWELESKQRLFEVTCDLLHHNDARVRADALNAIDSFREQLDENVFLQLNSMIADPAPEVRASLLAVSLDSSMTAQVKNLLESTNRDNLVRRNPVSASKNRENPLRDFQRGLTVFPLASLSRFHDSV